MFTHNKTLRATAWQNQQNDCPTRDPAKTLFNMGICRVWSESSVSSWRKFGSLATHWAHSEDWSDWADAQADLSFSWAHSQIVDVVMLRLFAIHNTDPHFYSFITQKSNDVYIA